MSFPQVLEWSHVGFELKPCPTLRFINAPLVRTLTPLHIQTQMYAIGAHVWYHPRSKGAPLLVSVTGPSPSGPEFLHIQYQGTGDKVVDHTEGCGPYSTQVMPVGGSTSCISSSPHHSASSSNHQPVPESPAEHVQQSKVLLTYKTNFHACAWGAKSAVDTMDISFKCREYKKGGGGRISTLVM